MSILKKSWDWVVDAFPNQLWDFHMHVDRAVTESAFRHGEGVIDELKALTHEHKGVVQAYDTGRPREYVEVTDRLGNRSKVVRTIAGQQHHLVVHFGGNTPQTGKAVNLADRDMDPEIVPLGEKGTLWHFRGQGQNVKVPAAPAAACRERNNCAPLAAWAGIFEGGRDYDDVKFDIQRAHIKTLEDIYAPDLFSRRGPVRKAVEAYLKDQGFNIYDIGRRLSELRVSDLVGDHAKALLLLNSDTKGYPSLMARHIVALHEGVPIEQDRWAKSQIVTDTWINSVALPSGKPAKGEFSNETPYDGEIRRRIAAYEKDPSGYRFAYDE